MSAVVDLEGEGLLDGVEGAAREARAKLLGELLAAGADLEELREAVAQGRLALIGVERALAGEERYTPRRVAELAGVDREVLEAQWRALGMVVDDPDQASLGAEDLEAAKRIRGFLDAGLEPAGIEEVARVMAMAMSQVAAANRQMVVEALNREGDLGAEDELETAHRLEALAEALVPMVGPALEHVYKMQLREQLRHAAVDDPALGSAEDGGGETMAIGFADLVGFTRLGEQLPVEEFGAISSRFGELASEVATGPVRLVKLIGDAVMLASSDPEALARSLLGLIDLADEEGEGFPAVRAGLGLGPVLPRGGDFYGRTVNLASRITGVARPDSLLVSEPAREALDGGFSLSDAGTKKLKGIDVPVRIFRCRDADEDGESGNGERERDEGGSGRSKRSSRRRRRR